MLDLQPSMQGYPATTLVTLPPEDESAPSFGPKPAGGGGGGRGGRGGHTRTKSGPQGASKLLRRCGVYLLVVLVLS